MDADIQQEAPAKPPKKLRPFRFDDDPVSSSKKFQIAGNELKIAGLLIASVLVAVGGYVAVRNGGVQGSTSAFTERKTEPSSLKPLSASSGANPDPTPLAAQSAASAPLEAASSASPTPPSEQNSGTTDSQVQSGIVGQQRKSVVLPTIERFQLALLVKKIDEDQVLVVFNGKEYLVKPGQTLPDNETVFVGFDRSASVMRTTAGDYRVFLK